MTAYLSQAEDLNYILDETEFSLYGKFQKADKRCMALIVQVLVDDHLIFVKDCNYSYKVLAELDIVYEKSGTACRICLRRQWQSVKIAENGDLEAHFCQLDELSAKLKNAGCEVSEREQVEQLLMSLLVSYDMTVEVLESMENMLMVTVCVKLQNQQEKLCFTVSGKNEDNHVKQSMLGSFHRGLLTRKWKRNESSNVINVVVWVIQPGTIIFLHHLVTNEIQPVILINLAMQIRGPHH